MVGGKAVYCRSNTNSNYTISCSHSLVATIQNHAYIL
ncbi:hypothetical protein SLEP1_g47407 [Rubroshorea leprosula]|uniref:Uncharacterized protein n=1 Tax=Rubroshorea leprosula TaxID=152421 RepID=A0AAV5LS40_9ROSI|nr:hypothetical protein SLEP1_g47407 [Rubroshorea leprosula]